MDEATLDAGIIEMFSKHPELLQRSAKVFGGYNVLSTIGLMTCQKSEDDSTDSLNQSIAHLENVLGSTTLDDPDCPKRLTDLSFALQLRYFKTGSLNDLSRAIGMMQAVILITKVDLVYVQHACNFADALIDRYFQSKCLHDLDAAIELKWTLMSLVSLSESDHESFQCGYLEALRSRINHKGTLRDVNEAIRVLRTMSSLATDDSKRVMCLLDLGAALCDRAERQKSMEDLCEAIDTTRAAINLMQFEDRDPNGFYRLGRYFLTKFDWTKSMSDLNEAIQSLTTAAHMTPMNDSQLIYILNALGNCHLERFRETESMDDIDLAISTLKSALETTTERDPHHLQSLSNLAVALHHKSEATKSIQDLDQAISILAAAADASLDNDGLRATYLSNLGHLWQCRFNSTKSIEDLECAIHAMEMAVQLNPTLPEALTGLAIALGCRFDCYTHSEDDLNKAIKLGEEAINMGQKRTTINPNLFSCLGMYLLSRYEETKSVADLTRASTAIETANEIILQSQLPGARPYFILGYVSVELYNKTGSSSHLDRGIQMCLEAVNRTSNEGPLLCLYLTSLGDALAQRLEITNSEDDGKAALLAYDKAIASAVAAPKLRLSACLRASALVFPVSPDLGKQYLRQAVALFPFVSPRSLSRRSQQLTLGNFDGFASTVAAASFIFGDDASQALQLLEGVRGIMTNLQLDMRSDVTALEASYPNHVKQYRKLRDCLKDFEHRTFETMPFALQTDMASDAARHQQFADQFDHLVAEIRALPGFERFLMRPTDAEFMKTAQEGAIVVFCVSAGRGDAVIVTKDQIRSLFLPNLTDVNVTENVHRLHRIIESREPQEYRAAKSDMKKILGWLWDVAVCPVLEELGFTDTPQTGDPWPMIWWMPTGLPSLFPLHAAGYHEPLSKNNALDRVISSYTPTIRALAYSRERALMAAASVLQQKMVLVGMPSTPGNSNLPFVERELCEINNVIPPDLRRLTLCNSTKQDVFSELRDCQIVHFACHGESEVHDPSKSRLLLKDWQTNPLTVDEVSSLDSQTAQLAFLSACHAARCRDMKLLDEAIHLSAAFQLAGFPYVIGTLWQVNDFHSTSLAKNVYAYLSRETNIDVSRSAEALHFAVRKLREETRKITRFTRLVADDPIVWTAYIHFGA